MENKIIIDRKMWFNIILFGLIGQIAWSVENMYFNLFVYNTIAKDTAAVTLMVQLSGICAAIVTLLAGTLSDKVANRKLFISWGYAIWGLIVVSFAFITKENTANIFHITSADKVISATIAIVIIMDCVMTLFGSTANDAAFNAWVTDTTTNAIRGKVEGVLSIMPLLALLIVAGGFGIIVEQIGYGGMFIGLGAIISISGIIGMFTIKDSPELKKTNTSYFKDLLYGFKPSVIKENNILYILLGAMCIYSIASQIFMPYLIIYLQEYLKFTVIEYSIVLGLVILLGAVAVVLISRYSDKVRKDKMLYIFVGLFALGLFLIYFAKGENHTLNTILIGIFGFIMIVGYISILSILGALIRDYTPEENAGKLQGVRIIFYVLIPMFIGPAIGQAINNRQNITYIDPDTLQLAKVPAPEIFIAAALVSLLMLIPLIFATKKISKNTNN